MSFATGVRSLNGGLSVSQQIALNTARDTDAEPKAPIPRDPAEPPIPPEQQPPTVIPLPVEPVQPPPPPPEPPPELPEPIIEPSEPTPAVPPEPGDTDMPVDTFCPECEAGRTEDIPIETARESGPLVQLFTGEGGGGQPVIISARPEGPAATRPFPTAAVVAVVLVAAGIVLFLVTRK